MSCITDMVIYTCHPETEAMAELNVWCATDDEARHQQFRPLDAEMVAGGTKVFTSYVWAMAGNYFRAEALAEMLPTFRWVAPETVVLIATTEDGYTTVTRAASPRGDRA